LPLGGRVVHGKINFGGAGIIELMSTSSSRRFLPHLQPEQEEEPTASPAPFCSPGRGLDYFSYYQDHCVGSRSRVTVTSLEVAGAGDVPVARGMASSRPAARGPDRRRHRGRAAARHAGKYGFANEG
jgi:hypothetical protein